ncbi:unnamed protein product [Phytophthora fragariaefolia]|uniref:Unnamed protein product n=1 Tax=Phytophthora fragariaefolia TaxID=1490495 RepID=A0A9W6XUY6_9STRA|nr:unnamed protein product [Phytophthora fragariaefolia]
MEKKLNSLRPNQDMFDFQAAHPPATASTLYSRSTSDPYFMSRDNLAEFVSCSNQWHALLCGRNTGEITKSQSTLNYRHTQTESLITRRSTALGYETSNHRRDMTVVAPTLTYLDSSETINVLLPEHFTAARTQLRAFFQNPSAKFFRSNDQCIATTIISQSVANLLVALATNGGKSLLHLKSLRNWESSVRSTNFYESICSTPVNFICQSNLSGAGKFSNICAIAGRSKQN